ncbi:unnamed protein product [Schistosoma bovis]|nr:unnamed protein product [Schistosoma bovis]
MVTSVLDSTVDSWATSYVSIVSGNTNSVLFASLMMLVSCEYKTPPIDNLNESHVLLNREKDPLCHSDRAVPVMKKHQMNNCLRWWYTGQSFQQNF